MKFTMIALSSALMLQLLLVTPRDAANAFAVLPSAMQPSSPFHHHDYRHNHQQHLHQQPTTKTRTTKLHSLVNVPEHFFAISLPILGIISTWTNQLTRRRLEERAWEQRVEEARLQRLRDDPTVTEIDLRRKEASMEWSAYGKPRREEEAARKERQMQQEDAQPRGRRRGVAVAERYDDDEQQPEQRNKNKMTDDEIDQFELEYGIDFDPYYDDPYTEDELPDDCKYKIDKKYGDRIYDNGEIFYKDRDSGLFYRQGAKPRNLAFWKK